MDASDEEGDPWEADKSAIPRSDADHLRRLESLGISGGINAQIQRQRANGHNDGMKKHERPDYDRYDSDELEHENLKKQKIHHEVAQNDAENQTEKAIGAELRSISNQMFDWLEEKVHGLGLRAVLQSLLQPEIFGLGRSGSLGEGEKEVRQMSVRHCLIEARSSPQISEGSLGGDSFAMNWWAALEAKHVLGDVVQELEETILQNAARGAVPEEFEEEEDLDSLEMTWITYPSDKTFSHHSVRPSFVEASPLPLLPSLISWTFNHRLDPVQARAIACVENDESVLLCAPTSAGKTAIAIYGLAMALHSNKRAIYTTPIKALSNQKYLELGTTFGGKFVGVMTGDTVIANDAPIVVMTLEILQSMLYKQARDPNLLDDFQCVVIDEAHFLGHFERGYAWEEVLILLPPQMQLILLSATMPNSGTVADWCARIQMQSFHVITSEQRPVPLSHDVFRCGPPDYFGKRRSFFSISRPPQNRFRGRNLQQAVQERAEILQNEAWRCPSHLISRFIGRKGQNLKQLIADLPANVRVDDGGLIQVTAADVNIEKEVQERVSQWLVKNGLTESAARPPNSSSDPLSLRAEDLERLLSHLWHKDQLPTIGFCFDKRMCERVALLLAGAKRMDFSTDAGKHEIRQRLQKGLENLNEEDQQLAQMKNCCDLLVRGIGVHHGGMLPLLREMVELLFADGFLPVIFATETFAVGLNMPAKSVIFTDVVKFDGQARRMLNAGAFRQMSGRAGRRGLDSEGHVYVMLHTDRIMRQPATEMLTKLYTEEPAPVKSCYRLRWSSLLHLISAGPAHVYAILTRSLLRFTERDAALSLQQEATEMVKVLQELDFIDQLGGTLPKGALACHLFVPEDALLVADIVIALRGFETFTAPQAFAICAAFVTEGAYHEGKISDPAVIGGLETCRHVARRLAATLHSHRLPCCNTCGLLKSLSCDGEAMIKSRLNPQFCEMALQWAYGEDFTSVVLSSGVATGGEGVVIRTLRRLDELMREITFVLRHDLALPEAAQGIQNARLSTRRGILATPSAYLREVEDIVTEEIDAEVPWPKQTWTPGQRVDLDPLQIGFSQATCGARFRHAPVPGGPDDILGLAKALCDGSIHPREVKPLSIYWFRHRYYSLDNRRLAAFRLFRLKCEDAKVPVLVLNRRQALERGWLKKFNTGFTGGQKIRITRTDRFVGVSRLQSTFARCLWETDDRS